MLVFLGELYRLTHPALKLRIEFYSSRNVAAP